MRRKQKDGCENERMNTMGCKREVAGRRLLSWLNLAKEAINERADGLRRIIRQQPKNRRGK